MTQEQEKALKIVEKLISDMGCHTLSAEEIMILTQGIMSNDCGGCNWKYVQVPQYQPGLEPGRQPGYRPGEVWCGDNPKISLYSNEGTTTLEELPNHFKNENEMIEEARKILAKNGDWTFNQTKRPTFGAGDNIPDMQYEIR